MRNSRRFTFYELLNDHEWAWDIADEIITKFNRMKRDVQADDVDLLKMIAEALVEAKGEVK